MPLSLAGKLSGRARRRLGALLLGLFMGLQVLASVPFLHALVHADCHDPTHECGVTLFTHGKIDAADSAVAIIRAAPVLMTDRPTEDGASISLEQPLPPGRGPPCPLLVPLRFNLIDRTGS